MPEIILNLGDEAIKGESRFDGLQDLIVCHSFSFSAHQPLDLGRGSNRSAGAMSVSEVQISRQFDSSSTHILAAMFSGKSFAEVKIHFLKAGGLDGKAFEEFLTVELTNAMLSGISYSGSAGGDMMMESISIGYVAIKYIYKVQKLDEAGHDGNINASFDMREMTGEKG
jgi:type VI secretion system Hcp family effector